MENRLKERLTGAAILVALIVLVVPEMFRGPGARGVPAGSAGAADSIGPAAAAPGATTEGAADGPPLRSYTIDLTHPGAAASPPRVTAAAGPAVTPVRAPVRAPVATVPALPAALGRAAEPALVAASAPEPTSGRPAAVHTPAAVHDARPAAAAPAGWGVQLGLFANGQNAQRLTHTARAKGFSTRISRTGSRGLYRVWIAGLADRAAAEQMSRKLHAAGLPAALIRPR